MKSKAGTENMNKKSDDMIKELSFKKYLFFKMIIISIVIFDSILSVFILDKFIKDEIFAISFYIDLFIILLGFTISTIVYKKSLEKKINNRLKRMWKIQINIVKAKKIMYNTNEKTK